MPVGAERTPAVPAEAVPAGTGVQSVAPAAGAAAVPFIRNRGEADQRVAYYARTFGGTVFVTHAGEVVYALPSGQPNEGIALEERLVGARPGAVTPGAAAGVAVSSFRGSDPQRWRTGLDTFAAVDLSGAYPGIDLRLSARANNVEKVFTVAPGADPARIRLSMAGADALGIDADGRLVATTTRGEVRFSAPVAFQEIGGTRRDVDVAYVVGDGEYGFELGAYDGSRPLVIDPTLASTFVGGTYDDYLTRIAFDPAGNVFTLLGTASTDFPTTPGAYSSSPNDLMVVKLDHDLTTLLAATFFGGSGVENNTSIDVDSAGNVFIGGHTLSTDIPMAGAPYQTSASTGDEAFVAKFSNDLGTLLASTYLSGNRNDAWCCGFHIRVASDDTVFVGMLTNSTNFPTTVGAFDNSYNDYDTDDVVISRLDNNLTTQLAGTYVGGSLWDVVYGMALDAADNVYIVGRTSSSNYPMTSGRYQGNSSDGYPYYDGFISKLSPDLTTLLASTYYGTSSNLDILWDVAPAPDGTIYVVGSTSSPALPVTGGAFDTTFNGGQEDSFVARFSGDLTTLLASSYLGGSAFERPGGLTLDAAGRPLIGGYTVSSDFPVTAGSPAFNASGRYDGVHVVMSPDLSSLVSSTLIGGSHDDILYAPVLDAAGNVYLGGYTRSADFPVSASAFDQTIGGAVCGGSPPILCRDGVIIRLGDLDSDGDGVADADDAFPSDPGETTDTDGDGIGDNTDLDDDNDGVLDAADLDPLNPSVCEDVDADGADDCTIGVDGFGPLPDNDPLNDGLDTDSDGLANVGDLDDDNDGVPDSADLEPLNPDVCEDVDADTADDCSVGTDDFGPLPDNDPSNDGPDFDGDGLADVGDPDDDGDTVADAGDSDPFNPYVCSDVDGDGADDCSSGTFDPLNDGLDTDSDGLADIGDPDDDNDGVLDTVDLDPLNPYVCEDVDADTADDCSVGIDGFGPAPDNDPNNDGLDTDGDGLADVGDPDDDNDGVPDELDDHPLIDGPDTDGDGVDDDGDADDDNDGVLDAADLAPLNPDVCEDVDGDGADDCSIGTDDFGPLPDNDPFNDGLDTDSDGLADVGDPDDDNDGVPDDADSSPLDRFVCSDVDGDGADDCSSGSFDPSNDGLDTDSDGLADIGDPDDDNDGVPDAADLAPLNPDVCQDVDADGADDCSIGTDDFGPLADNDPNNDGPDNDSDGIVDATDPDDDNDGTLDVDDAFPFDPAEDTDTDGDGIGNNADPDDDNDGFNDDVDGCPLEPGAFNGCPVAEVLIDVGPGSLNLGSNGTTPVVVFGTAAFDVTEVIPTTVTLSGAPVRLRGNGAAMASFGDFNGDGLVDLLVHVETGAMAVTVVNGLAEVVLEGSTIDGTQVAGIDIVTIVPPPGRGRN